MGGVQAPGTFTVWQDAETGAPTIGQVYQNTRGRPMFSLSYYKLVAGIARRSTLALQVSPDPAFLSDIVEVSGFSFASDGTNDETRALTGVIPPNHYYKVNAGTSDTGHNTPGYAVRLTA